MILIPLSHPSPCRDLAIPVLSTASPGAALCPRGGSISWGSPRWGWAALVGTPAGHLQITCPSWARAAALLRTVGREHPRKTTPRISSLKLCELFSEYRAYLLMKEFVKPIRIFKSSRGCFHSGHVPPKLPLKPPLLFFCHSCTALPLFQGILQTSFPLNSFMLREHSVKNYFIPISCCLFCLISA